MFRERNEKAEHRSEAKERNGLALVIRSCPRPGYAELKASGECKARVLATSANGYRKRAKRMVPWHITLSLCIDRGLKPLRRKQERSYMRPMKARGPGQLRIT